MYKLQRNYCSTGKSKPKRSDIFNMEHYSCSKVIQSNTATIGRERSQPLRLKELYKSPDISKSGKKASVREKSKPERLTLAFSGIKNTESALFSEGSRFGESDMCSQSGLRERHVRRKLNLNFATPTCSVNNKKSLYRSKTTNTKDVQKLNTTVMDKPENYQAKKMISNKGRTSFLMPPNTLKNKYLGKQSEKEKGSASTAKSDKQMSQNCEQKYSIISEERNSSTNLHNHTSRCELDQEATTEESQRSETNNKNPKDSEIPVNAASNETNIGYSKYRISSVQTIPARPHTGGCANINISGVHCIQPHSQVANLKLALCINLLPALDEPERDNSCKCEVQNATIGTTSLKHVLHDECKRVHPLKANVATVKSNLRNLIRTTEESLAQLKLTLSCIEDLSSREEDESTEITPSNDKDDQVANNKQSAFTSTESITDYIMPAMSDIKVDEIVQAQENTSNDDCDDTDNCFEILNEKDLPDWPLNHSGKVLSHESIDLSQTKYNDDNKENCEDIASTEKLEERRELKTAVANLIREANNDSFLALESELNILHLRPDTDNDLNTEHIQVNNRKKAFDCKGKFDKSFKEYMLLKSNLNCLETPNVKKFRSLSYTDTKSVPSSMHKTYMSSKVLAELQNLYTESPDS